MSQDPLALTNEIVRRIREARVAFAADGLSECAADVLIHLGFWPPLPLYMPWEDGPEKLGLGSQIAGASCDSATVEELRLYFKANDWPD